MDETKTTNEESAKDLKYRKSIGSLHIDSGATNVSMTDVQIVSSSKTKGEVRLRYAPAEEKADQDTSTEG